MSTHKSERDLWALSGMTIAATSAAVASFSGLRGLASAAGWPEHLAWLLPVTVDAYAMTSTRLWLAGRTRHRRARRFAAANALGAIAGSVAGNAVYHAVSTGLLPVSWPIVVSVGAVPAAVLGLIAHLHALHGRTEPTGTAEAELMDAARTTDQRHRDKHGRPMTRDALRAALKISGPRATELRRRLAASAPTAHVPDEEEVATQQ